MRRAGEWDVSWRVEREWAIREVSERGEREWGVIERGEGEDGVLVRE